MQAAMFCKTAAFLAAERFEVLLKRLLLLTEVEVGLLEERIKVASCVGEDEEEEGDELDEDNEIVGEEECDDEVNE